MASESDAGDASDAGADGDPGSALVRFAFGDATGAYVFLAAMVFFGTYWSVTFFSTDTLTLANALVAVSEGHLHIDEIVYGPSTMGQPGTYIVGGRLYGRNYGQLAVSLPILLAVRGFSSLLDLRILLVGTWCLGVLALVVRVGDHFGRRDQAAVLGSGAVLLLFALNLGFATRIPTRLYPLLALQVGSMVAAALLAVVLYRWIGALYGTRVGLAAGVGTALATPVGFWASIPKRHSLTALLVVLVLFSFYRSRTAGSERAFRRFRALSYVWVALTAWVHGGEAFVLLLALGVVDLPTARTNAPRTLAVVGVAFAVALVPFLLTNVAVTGNPLEPPRLAPGFDSSELPPGVDPSPGADPPPSPGGQPTPTPDPGTPTPRPTTTPDPGGGATTDPGGTRTTGPTTGAAPTPTPGGEETATPPTAPGGGGNGGGGGAGPLSFLGGIVGAAVALFVNGVDALGSVFDRFWSYVSKSLRILTDFERLGHVFLRSGYVPLGPRQDVPVNLAMLESMPLFGALAAVPVLALRRVRSRRSGSARPLSPARQTDLLALAVLALFLLVYLPRLPIHHMYTVRYLHPFYPVGVYLLVRLPAVRDALADHTRELAGAYGATVLAGVPLYLVTIQSLGLVRSEAVQLFALVALALAGVVAGWAVLDTAFERLDFGRPGAVFLAVAAGATTVYLLVGGVELFARGTEAALPLVRFVGESIRAVTG